ncbi:MAG: tRNA (guanosine(37)-N1)-methyltransferase TrmD [Gammaproteobacteria bacterium]|nr:tRNA (guanosine(37)-N1)-methyltransferase TrmD [Gammaproteobacteria bacterium]
MKITCITLFPKMLDAVTESGVVGRAMTAGLAGLQVLNPRDFTTDVHRTVDDRPYGGGPGMVMKAAPLATAIATAKRAAPPGAPVLMLSPQGTLLTQQKAVELAQLPGLVLVAGRYEGVDERVLDMGVDAELSIGNYVLSGGELAAMVVIDSVVRLLPGVLGDERSADEDSFMRGLLDYPHYTRPDVIDGRAVPPVLASGDHEQIANWRLKQALGRTWQRRPQMLEERGLSTNEQHLLDEYIQELNNNPKDP